MTSEFREKIQRLVKKRHQREKENALIMAVCDKVETLTAENDRLKARVAELEGALWGCIDEMMSLAHDSFDGVWNEQDFLAIEKPFRTALKNKDASDD